MANLQERFSMVERELREAAMGGKYAGTHVLRAVTQLTAIVLIQEERTQRIADALDELAGKIGYLSSSPREVREQVQAVARLIRGENEKGV